MNRKCTAMHKSHSCQSVSSLLHQDEIRSNRKGTLSIDRWERGRLVKKSPGTVRLSMDVGVLVVSVVFARLSQLSARHGFD